MAFTCTTSSGGKNPGSAGAWAVFQARQPFFEEAFSPAADDLASRAKTVGNLIIRQSLVSEQDHLGAGHHKIRQRIFIGAPLQFLSFLRSEDDSVRTFARQLASPQTTA
jgi:hypothetical protein